MKLTTRFFIQGLLCLFICFISATAIYGQNNDFQHKKDSLLNVIASTQGEEKLKAYGVLTNSQLQFPDEEIDSKLQYINDFILEARKQKNKEYESIAYRNKLACFWNHLKFDEFDRVVNEYLSFFKKNNFHGNYYDFYECLILRRYGGTNNYKHMIEGVKEMYIEAQQEDCLYGIIKATSLIANIYIEEKRYEEAEKYYRETIKNALKLIKEEPGQLNNYRLVSSGYYGLSNALWAQNKINELLSLMPVWKKHTTVFEKKFDYPEPNLRYYYKCYAEIYIEKGEYDLAESYCDSMKSIISPLELFFVWNIKAAICNGREEYDSAINWIDKIIEDRTNLGDLSQVIFCLIKKASMLSEMGRAKELYSVFDSYIELNDSLRLLENNAQLDEIRTQYEVDKYVAEKEQQRIIIFSLIVVCVVSLIALGIWIYYYRKVTQKNRTLAQQIKKLTIQQEEQINEMLAKTSFLSDSPNETTAVETTINPDLCIESRMDKLCIAIRDLLLKEKIYRNSTITQEQVVERLGTNKNVFAKAMEYCLKTTFKDYVNSLRLKDAVQLLEHSDLSIEEISEMIGFGTIRTLQNQFNTKYNMTPKNYRYLAKTTM